MKVEPEGHRLLCRFFYSEAEGKFKDLKIKCRFLLHKESFELPTAEGAGHK